MNEETFAWLKEQASLPKTVAIGESDWIYYWDKSQRCRTHSVTGSDGRWNFARETNLPVIIHSRDRVTDTMEVMKEGSRRGDTGVIHCYSYSRDGTGIYQNGLLHRCRWRCHIQKRKKLKETVEAIPLERILLETDCPYMAPEPHRGTRNDSSNIPFVIAKIAEVKGITEEEVERVTEENAVRLFTKVS